MHTALVSAEARTARIPPDQQGHQGSPAACPRVPVLGATIVQWLSCFDGRDGITFSDDACRQLPQAADLAATSSGPRVQQNLAMLRVARLREAAVSLLCCNAIHLKQDFGQRVASTISKKL